MSSEIEVKTVHMLTISYLLVNVLLVILVILSYMLCTPFILTNVKLL